MVFSSPTFLLLFLPVLLIVYLLSPGRLKNVVLLLASLFFYAWGEGYFVIVMLASIVANFIFGIVIESRRSSPIGKWLVGAAVAANLCLLISYKYANFVADNVSIVLAWAGLPEIVLAPVHLPIGISFFTFQAMSYIIDIYRGTNPAQRNPVDLALYISLFPQLVAGPIVRYHDIAKQISSREITAEDFSIGSRRFIAGFAKKMIIANPLGEVADTIFALPASDVSPEIAWLGIICYTLQIYFDFSGYSDMAIGLGRMFGFKFLENFNYPYISLSIQEFWRRWHISLSNWFRDYLYIPLGGNRVSNFRVYFNLVTVFVLCGLWHGASWNFLIWGLIHGAFLVIEKLGLGHLLGYAPRFVRHFYVLLVVILAWVFFRVETLPDAVTFLQAMFDLSGAEKMHSDLGAYYNDSVIFAVIIGCLFSTPALPYLSDKLLAKLRRNAGMNPILDVSTIACYVCVFYLAITYLAAGTYNPFIYFRF
jgi:alginate O-acetyltransferase complex protein AlgI